MYYSRVGAEISSAALTLEKSNQQPILQTNVLT